MQPLWRTADLIDLEYLLLRDEAIIKEKGDGALKRRDRKIYLKLIESESEAAEKPGPSLLLHGWLENQRRKMTEEDDTVLLPGKLWQELDVIFRWGLLIFGLMSGAGLAFSFLAYSGSEPVNVSVYLGLFVGIQVLLLALFGVTFLCRLLLRLDLRSSVLYVLLSRLMILIIMRLKGYVGKTLSGGQRLRMASAMGLVRKKTHGHGSLFFWPIFALLQILALGFNSGVLAATLLKVTGEDIAFGWQSTLQVSEAFVFKLVQCIALPWSWFVPLKSAYPSLAQIEGSQMILKEGIYHLATRDLVSWWPFLCLSVLFYGLLPRLILFFAGLGWERLSLARLRFTGTTYRQLLHRMITPRVSTRAPEPDTFKRPFAPEPPRPAKPKKKKTTISISEEQVDQHATVTLIPDELYDQCPMNTLQILVRDRLGLKVSETLRTGEEEADDQLVFDQLAEKNSTSIIDTVIVLQEAWQPPIQEFFSFLGKLRSFMGAEVPLIVALVGKPASQTIFTPVTKKDLRIWRENIRALGYADLQVVEWVTA